ncbi:right-handed parallel beta-helix repeat-containing protein [Dyella jiangningensis]|uniref:Pectate lyase superfamily protein domain-containing protein n=1 Tax=Dyella jiangningensis TaxID=1379159 RepID=A0A328P695_9GAMM|nr:right-handed parallel beta-helix repeat-containing protein [Dyella jiangningensis]RAO76262.1 hypothetical protein CA260_11250 [Dyella jiangningensis]
MSTASQAVNVLNFLPEKERAAIRAGVSTYDCTMGIQAAIDSSSKVFIPSGTYLVKQIDLKSGLELYGEGSASQLKAYDNSLQCEFMMVTHIRDGGTKSVADNMRNVHLHDFLLNGRVDEFGYMQYFYLLAVNATSDMLVERVTFHGFRGDGMYVGSGTLHDTERHNQRIVVRDCLFDGLVKANRNGLSIIDCDTLTVDGCTFQNIGNAKLSSSVGAIDFEPDHNWGIYRNIIIRRCKFIDINSVNTAGITFFNGHQTGDNIHGWTVSDCEFVNCYWGIYGATKPKTKADPTDDLTIVNCNFVNSIRYDVFIGGLSNTQISGCTFQRSPPGSGPGGDAVRLGTYVWKASDNAVRAVVTGNTFIGIRPQMGAVGIYGANDVVCAGNTFIDIRGSCLSFAMDDTSDKARKIQNVVISGNVARRAPQASGVSRGVMSFLSTSNEMRTVKATLSLGESYEYNNSVEDGITKIAAGSAIQFLGS